MKIFNKNMKNTSYITLILLLFTQFFTVDIVHAASFDPTRIIDDSVFYNKSSMSVQQIQDFLNSKIPNCDTNHSGYTGGSGTIYSPPWVCLNNYYENPTSTYSISYSYLDSNGNSITGSETFTHNNAYIYTALKPVYVNGDYRQGLQSISGTIQSVGGVIPSNSISAAQIIWNAAQTYDINPEVILVILQKESGLVTDTWPQSWEYQQAMGYGCPDTAPCDHKYSGFYNQVISAAWQFRDYANNPNKYNYVMGPGNNVYFSPVTQGCPNPTYTTLNIQNQATASLYDYTPYQPDAAAISAGYGTGDGCSSYGNRNFWLYFNAWFGSTYAFIHNGLDYSPVFDPVYYLNNNPDVAQATGGDQLASFNHFINYGMNEGRQASANFNVNTYRNRYPDLRWAFGNNLSSYYIHYITNGQAEGRTATGTASLQPVSSYNGIDYSAVYNFNDYENYNSDLKAAFGLDDIAALKHFVNYGMNEGRQASAKFNVFTYKSRYTDLRAAFGNNLKAYYLHFISNGQYEGRSGI